MICHPCIIILLLFVRGCCSINSTMNHHEVSYLHVLIFTTVVLKSSMKKIKCQEGSWHHLCQWMSNRKHILRDKWMANSLQMETQQQERAFLSSTFLRTSFFLPLILPLSLPPRRLPSQVVFASPRLGFDPSFGSSGRWTACSSSRCNLNKTAWNVHFSSDWRWYCISDSRCHPGCHSDRHSGRVQSHSLVCRHLSCPTEGQGYQSPIWIKPWDTRTASQKSLLESAVLDLVWSWLSVCSKSQNKDSVMQVKKRGFNFE